MGAHPPMGNPGSATATHAYLVVSQVKMGINPKYGDWFVTNKVLLPVLICRFDFEIFNDM